MKGKRETLELIHDILLVVQKGKVKRTHVMYKANLSPKMLDSYLKDLIERELVMEYISEKNKTYSLAEKGFKYLQEYKVIVDFVDSFGLE